jgi:hypothetical protein
MSAKELYLFQEDSLHQIRASVPALSFTVVRVREPLKPSEQVIWTGKEVKDERVPWGVTPERYVGTVLPWCGL